MQVINREKLLFFAQSGVLTMENRLKVKNGRSFLLVFKFLIKFYFGKTYLHDIISTRDPLLGGYSDE